MKARYIIFLSVLILSLWFVEKRKFIKVGNSYLTLWKQYNDKSYIIQGRYYGLFSPSTGYIKANNVAQISIFTIDSFPSLLIFNTDDSVIVKNESNVIQFENYKNKPAEFHKLLFQSEDRSDSDLKKGVCKLMIDIRENYVIRICQ